MTQLKTFVANNVKALILALSFIATMYVQHTNNISKITELEVQCENLELKIRDQYEKIDAIKLDKAVFEANMQQFASIQTDLREMRADIKELLKSKR
jgi:type I restriction-modification system DNA methylase subunit